MGKTRRIDMIIKNLMIFCLVAALPSAAASEPFTVRDVLCKPYPDSLVMTISGEGNPVFRTYDLNNPYRVVVEIENATLLPGPVKKSFSDPVSRLEIQPDYTTHPVIRIVCELVDELGFDSHKEDGKIIVVFENPGRSIVETETLLSETPEWMSKRVNVDFEDTPLGSALALLARQNGFDIVTPQFDDMVVSAHLTQATITNALDAILSVSGFVYYTTGDVIVVKPLADEIPGGLTTKIFKLEYIDGRQIEKQVQNMLSSRGKAQIVSAGQSTSGPEEGKFPAKILAVTDLATVIPVIEEFISKIDVKPEQVAIDVKLVETGITEDQSFGLDWRKSVTAAITGAEEGMPTTESSPERLSLFSTLPFEAGSFTYGTMNVSEVSLLLEYLKSTGNSKLLSNPSVTTSDGKPAIIDVVTTIPIQTINRFSEGAVIQDIVTYQFKDVGISLEVTPVLNDDDYITLNCRPTVEEITGWVGPADNQQPITSKRSVRTDVIVKNGETLVIGGLMKESTITRIDGVWLLSDIPLIGELFKHRTVQSTKTDLMILITPSILR
jgi:type IV pilus assembly protein PilQ